MPQRFLQQAKGSQELAEDDGLCDLAAGDKDQNSCLPCTHIGSSQTEDSSKVQQVQALADSSP